MILFKKMATFPAGLKSFQKYGKSFRGMENIPEGLKIFEKIENLSEQWEFSRKIEIFQKFETTQNDENYSEGWKSSKMVDITRRCTYEQKPIKPVLGKTSGVAQ